MAPAGMVAWWAANVLCDLAVPQMWVLGPHERESQRPVSGEGGPGRHCYIMPDACQRFVNSRSIHPAFSFQLSLAVN